MLFWYLWSRGVLQVEGEECAALHVISAFSGVTNLTGISVYFVPILLTHACSGWKTACLSEEVATLSRPALDQDQWGNSLSGCCVLCVYITVGSRVVWCGVRCNAPVEVVLCVTRYTACQVEVVHYLDEVRRNGEFPRFDFIAHENSNHQEKKRQC